jgi:hypothetical protein
MRITLARIEARPFGQAGVGQSAIGADIEPADAVLLQ